ncbi:acetate--CoA ligase family protein, partial [Bordetella bronchiseptica F4563]
DVAQGNGGFLVIKRPWPAMIRNIWGDPERFKKSYFCLLYTSRCV